MDTALALMHSQEPVYPLDIVRTMRDQRACMVQNVVSTNTNLLKYSHFQFIFNFFCQYRVNIDLCVSAFVLRT